MKARPGLWMRMRHVRQRPHPSTMWTAMMTSGPARVRRRRRARAMGRRRRTAAPGVGGCMLAPAV